MTRDLADNKPQNLRRGSRESMVVSVVRDGEVAISTSLARYLQLNERELRWLVEVAGPRALAAFAEAGR